MRGGRKVERTKVRGAVVELRGEDVDKGRVCFIGKFVRVSKR